jgi:hypothetical protein
MRKMQLFRSGFGLLALIGALSIPTTSCTKDDIGPQGDYDHPTTVVTDSIPTVVTDTIPTVVTDTIPTVVPDTIPTVVTDTTVVAPDTTVIIAPDTVLRPSRRR